MKIDSRSWTGLEPTFTEKEGYGSRVDWWADGWHYWKQKKRNAFAALLTLWIPARPKPPRDRRKGWTPYDGYFSGRGDDWTLARALIASIAILLGRRHGQREVDRFGFQSSAELAYWDSRTLYAGWSCMCLSLYPRCRVEIYSDGDWDL